MQHTIVNNIFDEKISFEQKLEEVFSFQYKESRIYRQWADALHFRKSKNISAKGIPFLPISFFKTSSVTSGNFIPEAIFESSGTTGMQNSRHYVRYMQVYEQSFLTCFNHFYGTVDSWCVLALLPAYLERQNSSLVVMADALIKKSGHSKSGFYLYDFEQLYNTLIALEQQQQKTLLIGVTFALLDFAAAFPMHLQHTTIIETGGMKGRKKEMTRQEVQQTLCNAFRLPGIHSEYGMTELLSQAYSKGNGIFRCPPWMKVLVRDEQDPLTIKETGRGVLNIIDLANVYSCSFIATDDVGIVHDDGSFEVHGRMDNSDIRGCSLLAL